MSNSHPPWIRSGRYLWGGLALIILFLLGLSVIVSPPGLESAETSARQRAERVVADVLLGELAPRLASDDIVGTERGDLLEVVQRRILTDDRVARVLIWRPDGDLIFSTGPEEATSEIAADHLQFSQAANGVSASVVVEAGETRESVHQTFVPMRVPNEIPPYAVAQIDQRYSAVQAEATRVWRPLQVGLGAALGLAAVLFVLSFVIGRPARPAAEPQPTSDEPRLRAAEERARAAEERARIAEQAARRADDRHSDAERHSEEAPATEIPPEVLERIQELEMNLRGEVAEREQSAAQLQQLRASLEAKEAEVARATERTAEAETERSAELVAEADRRAADAESRAADVESRAADVESLVADAESRTADAESRAADAESRTADVESLVADAESRVAYAGSLVADAESRVAYAESRAADAQTRAEEAERRAMGAADRIAASEARVSELETALRQAEERAAGDLHTAQLEANTLKQKLAEIEASFADARAKLAAQERVVPGSGAAVLEIDLLRTERDVAAADLRRAQHELETLRDELDSARESIAELDARRRDELA